MIIGLAFWGFIGMLILGVIAGIVGAIQGFFGLGKWRKSVK